MVHLKLFFLVVVFVFITLGSFVAGLEVQDTEEKNTHLQEFVKKAQEDIKQNQIEEAVKLYERIVVAAPDDLESRAQLATLYTRIEQHEKAAQTYNELLEDDPENIKYQDELVNSLRAADKPNEAYEIAQAYIQMDPELGVHYARLARLYEADGNIVATIENYKKAISHGYEDKSLYFKLAEHYFLNDDIDAAEKALNKAMIFTTSEWEKESIEFKLLNLYRYQGNLEEMLLKAEADGTLTISLQKQRAQYFRNIGELEKSIVHYKKAIGMTNSPYERNDLARDLLKIYSKHDRIDLAIDFFEVETSKQIITKGASTSSFFSGITVYLGSDDTRKTLINVCKNHGQLDVLRTFYEGKLEKDAINPTILELLAEIYWEYNDYQKSAETYLLLGKTEPMSGRSIRSFYLAAAAYEKNNQPDMAKVVLNQADTALASSNYKDDSLFMGALATICLNNELSDTALKLAVNATAKAKNWRNSTKFLYKLLARSYLAANRYDDAFEAYQQIAKIAIEDHNGTMQRRAEDWMTEVAKAGNLYEKWIPEQRKQVEQNPNDTERILKLAQGYEASERIKEAVVQYERLTELEPEKSYWHRKLGDLYQNLPQESRETGTVSEGINPKRLVKSITSYEKAIELEPNLYEVYDLLAKSYLKSDRAADAEKVYRQALEAPLSESNHESAVQAIAGFYADEGREDKRIAILEEFKPKVDQSVVLLELLGDVYQKVADAEKAELVYEKWLQIQLKAFNRTENAYRYGNFANKLLDKGLYPETALSFAKRAFAKTSSSSYGYFATLGRAFIANGLYDEALRHFKHALSLIPDEYYSNRFWEEIAEGINNAKDKERYIQMLETLIDFISLENSEVRANVYRSIAEHYTESEMPEKAEEYLLKNGFIPETAWLTLGPFNNKDSVGAFVAYIPEETTQIDTTAEYYGIDKLIRWKKTSDTKLDGRYDFGNEEGINDLCVAYVWTVVISPDDREITFRFDSDDQGFIWLNGKHIFEHSRANVGGGAAQIDRHSIPVTLKQGENTILIKVCNSIQAWDMYMRLTDADGNSFEDLKFKSADELLNEPPPEPTFHLNVNLGLAEYYSKNNMFDKAMEQMRPTGILHENTWLVLGPYDNSAGIGYDTKYITENTTQIDLTAKYEGVDEQISWKKFTDDAFNGFIDFGEDVNWRVAYAWTIVTSPDEREVLFRFGSDDQSKIWLNGTEVFADTNAQAAIPDRNTIPVTFKAGNNTILVKVCNEELSWGFYMRITDADGKAYDDLKINEVQDN